MNIIRNIEFIPIKNGMPEIKKGNYAYFIAFYWQIDIKILYIVNDNSNKEVKKWVQGV